MEMMISTSYLLAHTGLKRCQHHRDDANAAENLHPKFFLIFDRDTPQQRGILLVNLKPYGVPRVP
jgi:hypothetical protein